MLFVIPWMRPSNIKKNGGGPEYNNKNSPVAIKMNTEEKELLDRKVENPKSYESVREN
jgi:hypothetical protein